MTERAAVKPRSQQSSYLVSLSGVCEQEINIFSTLVHAEMIFFFFFHLPSYRRSYFNINQKSMFVEIRFAGFLLLFSLCTSVLRPKTSNQWNFISADQHLWLTNPPFITLLTYFHRSKSTSAHVFGSQQEAKSEKPLVSVTQVHLKVWTSELFNSSVWHKPFFGWGGLNTSWMPVKESVTARQVFIGEPAWAKRASNQPQFARCIFWGPEREPDRKGKSVFWMVHFSTHVKSAYVYISHFPAGIFKHFVFFLKLRLYRTYVIINCLFSDTDD